MEFEGRVPIFGTLVSFFVRGIQCHCIIWNNLLHWIQFQKSLHLPGAWGMEYVRSTINRVLKPDHHPKK